MPAGLKAEVFAAEPLLANPVAFCFDEQGRAYVAETFRLHRGVTDNRSHPPVWTDDDLAARTVADRIALYKKHLGRKFAEYGKHEDRVRVVYDSDGDGRADKASIFAAGFNRPEDGLGSGVLAHGGKVWFANIPDLWLLQDTKNAGRADVKRSLHTGYGVHVAFIGHDLHGLAIGPDGKLYFDRRPRIARRRGRQDAVEPGLEVPCSAATPTARCWRSSPPACAIRKSWPSTSWATSSPATTTPTAAIRPLGPRCPRRRQRLLHRLPVPPRPGAVEP